MGVTALPLLISIEILPHFPVTLNKEGELMNTLGEHAQTQLLTQR